MQYGVYFIQNVATKSVKIGKWSGTPQDRLTALQTGNESELILLAVQNAQSHEHATALENELHRKFWHTRKLNEWFNYTRELEEYIKPFVSGTPKQDTAETKILRDEINRLLSRVAEQNSELERWRTARPNFIGQKDFEAVVREKACPRCTVKIIMGMSDSRIDLTGLRTKPVLEANAAQN